uniref:Uncharacterized protein n=1 Tax=viral metagenome TaxID=1070528 RepID=A0A6C0EA40_9ZZZZ
MGGGLLRLVEFDAADIYIADRRTFSEFLDEYKIPDENIKKLLNDLHAEVKANFDNKVKEKNSFMHYKLLIEKLLDFIDKPEYKKNYKYYSPDLAQKSEELWQLIKPTKPFFVTCSNGIKLASCERQNECLTGTPTLTFWKIPNKTICWSAPSIVQTFDNENTEEPQTKRQKTEQV